MGQVELLYIVLSDTELNDYHAVHVAHRGAVAVYGTQAMWGLIYEAIESQCEERLQNVLFVCRHFHGAASTVFVFFFDKRTDWGAECCWYPAPLWV